MTLSSGGLPIATFSTPASRSSAASNSRLLGVRLRAGRARAERDHALDVGEGAGRVESPGGGSRCRSGIRRIRVATAAGDEKNRC